MIKVTRHGFQKRCSQNSQTKAKMHLCRLLPIKSVIWMLLFQFTFYSSVMTNSTNNSEVKDFGDNSSQNMETITSKDTTISKVILGVVLVTITVGAIIGNVFVIAAILLEKNLQNFQYYLTISLAVADLLIGAVVMPFGIYNKLNNGWTLSPELCDFWASSDVLCCTASILNLVAIAFDRYWAITNCVTPRSTSRIIAMIVAVWSVSLAIAVAPQFGWMDSEHLNRVLIKHECIPSLDLGYQMLSFAATIYIPLPVILYLYWKIYQTARKSLRWKKEQRLAISNLCKKDEVYNETTLSKRKSFFSNKIFTKNKDAAIKGNSARSAVSFDDPSSSSTAGIMNEDDKSRSNDGTSSLPSVVVSLSDSNLEKISFDQSNENTLNTKKETTTHGTLTNPVKHSSKKNENCQHMKKENRTAMILAIITGAFIVCWLPYFVLNLLTTRFGVNDNPVLSTFLGWMAYFNSTINPIIYTIFSPEFRLAFRRMVSRVMCSRNRGKYL